MFTLFKNIIKAIVTVALLFAMVSLAFWPAGSIYIMVGSSGAAAWLIFYLVAMITVMFTLLQENAFSKKVNKLGKAFWEW